MERKLASIRIVRAISPIKGADFIELAQIDGWRCVVKKGEFQVGQPGIYFEIDSFLPVEPRFEFLRKSSFKRMLDEEGFRLRSTKLKGQLSQGLLLPLKDFPEFVGRTEGTDLTEELHVKKYDPPMPPCLTGVAKGRFPALIPKTDAERIQNLPEYFEIHRSELFEITEKLDGASMTVYCRHGQLGVCSRNLELEEYASKRPDDERPDDERSNTPWKITRHSGLDKALLSLNRDLAVQGELVGEGINGVALKIRGQRFFVFNIFDIDQGRYLTPPERRALYRTLRETCTPELDHVPVIEEAAPVFSRHTTLDALLAAAEGESALKPQSEREGLVFKSLEHPDVQFKAVSNKYLLGAE